MVTFAANILAVIVLIVIAWRRGRDRRTAAVPTARILKIAGALVLGLVALIYLYFGAGEMMGGIEGGVGHLVELLAVVLLLALAWIRPLEGGIALMVCGVLSALGFTTAMLSGGPEAQFSMISSALLITSLPQVISGALFFAAGLMGRKTAVTQAHA